MEVENPRLYIRRYRSFLQTIGDAKIEDYFNIRCKPGNHLTFSVDRPSNANYCYLYINYWKRPEIINFPGLPTVVCSHILSYAHNSIQLKFKIWFPSTYPFCPPTWSLEEEKNTMCLPPEYNLKEYFQDVVNRHNEIYNRSRGCRDQSTNWSPAIGVDSDILYFILKINHFDELCDL